MKTTLLTITLLATFVVTVNVQAKVLDGGSDRGGGDSLIIRSKIFEKKKASLIKQTQDLFNGNNRVIDVRNILSWFNRQSVKTSDAKSNAILQDMRARGFAKNLFATEFELKEKCIDKDGLSKTATTSMNVMGSVICINAAKLVDDFGPYIQDSDIVGLLMHEYSHHFGYEDKDHSFAAAIAETFQADSERRNEEGDPLNYFIK